MPSMRFGFFTLVLFSIVLAAPTARGQGAASAVSGEPAAVAAAQRLLAAVGGAEVWRARQLVARETVYLRSGGTAMVELSRDFEAKSRIFRITADDGLVHLELISPERGWVSRNGALRDTEGEALKAAVQGLRQEPYMIYHRLARGGAGLVASLHEGGRRLVFAETGGEPLCWFNLDAKGSPYGWGNHWDGRLVQHHYGPFVPMGGGYFPKWGAAHDGSWRFEYTAVRFLHEPLALPERPR